MKKILKIAISGRFWVPLGLQNRWLYLGKTRFLVKFTFFIFVVSGAFWAPFWVNFSIFLLPWDLLGGLWGVFWATLGVLGVPLGPSGGLLGGLGEPLGVPLGVPWPILGPQGSIWEPFGVDFGDNSGVFSGDFC